eukprot:5266851-Prymnesium_polylepis.1
MQLGSESGDPLRGSSSVPGVTHPPTHCAVITNGALFIHAATPRARLHLCAGAEARDLRSRSLPVLDVSHAL